MAETVDDVLGGPAPDQVRLRFSPSPTGSLHIGNVRTRLVQLGVRPALRRQLVLRIEDTDDTRNTDEGLQSVIGSLRWLGIDWDEGPEVGGPFAPYIQSERLDIYADVAQRLRESGRAYDCYCSQDELEERTEQARKAGRTLGVRRPLPPPDTGAGRGIPRGGPAAGAPPPDAGPHDRLRPTWSAARSASGLSMCRTTFWCGRTANRSTRLSTRSTTR